MVLLIDIQAQKSVRIIMDGSIIIDVNEGGVLFLKKIFDLFSWLIAKMVPHVFKTGKKGHF